MTKPFTISKNLIMQAYRQVKANAGSAGIDQQSIAGFEINLRDNLYRLWNRMSSGSYFPKAVKRVVIPKKTGGERTLGVPTIEDRVAQTAAKIMLEQELEPYFHADSYGYRPGRSALDAVRITNERSRKYAFVIEFDIKALFDTIPWDKLMKAVHHHTKNKWVILYIERWLRAPMETLTGEQSERISGTPQGSPLSPLLANLFMHYAFDMWMQRRHPDNPWCRYADDGIIHCRNEQEAQALLAELEMRMMDCGIEIHPQKTQIVYCSDGKRREKYERRQFDFLGYTFRQRLVKNSKDGSLFLSFSPGMSARARKAICAEIRASNIRNRSELSLDDIAQVFNPKIRGWVNYYGRYHREELAPLLRHLNRTLVAWAMRKYNKLRRSKTRAGRFLIKICENNPELFEHWRFYYGKAFA